jgi:hypothetical protein
VVSERLIAQAATLGEESIVALALKLIEVSGRAMLSQAGGKDAGVVVNNNPQTIKVEQPETTDDEVVALVAALVESGVFDAALERYLARQEARATLVQQDDDR